MSAHQISFTSVKWRHFLGPKDGNCQLGFIGANGDVIRLAISAKEALMAMEAIRDSLVPSPLDLVECQGQPDQSRMME
jgi:hypothetical protein